MPGSNTASGFADDELYWPERYAVSLEKMVAKRGLHVCLIAATSIDTDLATRQHRVHMRDGASGKVRHCGVLMPYLHP